MSVFFVVAAALDSSNRGIAQVSRAMPSTAGRTDMDEREGVRNSGDGQEMTKVGQLRAGAVVEFGIVYQPLPLAGVPHTLSRPCQEHERAVAVLQCVPYCCVAHTTLLKWVPTLSYQSEVQSTSNTMVIADRWSYRPISPPFA